MKKIDTSILENFSPERIQDENARQGVVALMNLVEALVGENSYLRGEVQRLRDEVNRLKGEQGKPKIKGKKPEQKKQGAKHSSEKERYEKRRHQKGSKRKRLNIDREEVLKADKESMPGDVVFKGYEEVLVQDLEIKTANVLFRREKYYSPGKRKTYLAPLPRGYKGAFGPRVRALVPSLYHIAGMTEPKIVKILAEFGIEISAGKVSDLLIKDLAEWEAEGKALYRAGLSSTSWQHIDDTPTRVNGENSYCHIVGNPYYAWYDTRQRKDRLTVIAVLQNKELPDFLYKEESVAWLEAFKVPKWAIAAVKKWPQGQVLSWEAVTKLTEGSLGGRLNKQQEARVLEAGALTAYYAQEEMPTVPILMSDDAGQFANITAVHALCWVHEGRHYKKLIPALAYHRQLLDSFQKDFWDFYRELLAYKKEPTPANAEKLTLKFDELFGRETGYAELDKRIAKTKAKKAALLVALTHPEVPLHNNPAELAVRQRVRKRDISFGPRTEEGKRAWDLFASLSETANKLDVSFYQYLYDRISGAYRMPSLADMIQEKTAQFAPP